MPKMPAVARKFLASAHGDTIIEVLVSLAVLAGGISISYAVANRSLNQSQDARERTDAVTIARSQLELIRELAQNPNSGVFSGHQLFCISSTDVLVSFAGITSLPPLDSDDFSHYPADCKNLNNLYNVAVSYSPADGDVFTATVRWYRLGGGRDTVQLAYRLHAPLASDATSPPSPPSPPPSPPPSCPDVNFNIPSGAPRDIWNAPGRQIYRDNSVSLPRFGAGCSYYLAIHTHDSHPQISPGHYTDPEHQQHEELYAQFYYNGRATPDVVTGLTCDLPDDAQDITSTFTSSFSFSQIPKAIEFKHYSLYPGATDLGHNSIQPVGVSFSATPFTGLCINNGT